jgi:hypothetical protein
MLIIHLYLVVEVKVKLNKYIDQYIDEGGLGCLMPLSTIFQLYPSIS